MGTPSVAAVKYLFAHSRNLCFFNIIDGDDRKTCEVHLTERGYNRCLGQIAHISSDRPGGPRYDPALSEIERQSEANLMLLCPNCHKRIDDLEPERFPVGTLLAMKERHLAHASEGWRPEAALVSRVAEDMVAYFIERTRRVDADADEPDDDDAPSGVMGSSGIGYMSDTVGPIEARQMWVDAWRSGQSSEALEAARLANRRERQLNAILERHGLTGDVYLQYADDGSLIVTGSSVDPMVLQQLAQAGGFASVRNETT